MRRYKNVALELADVRAVVSGLEAKVVFNDGVVVGIDSASATTLIEAIQDSSTSAATIPAISETEKQASVIPSVS